ncbi:MAG: hypothetical protein ACPGUV_00490 [Polyangiales bacterium]
MNDRSPAQQLMSDLHRMHGSDAKVAAVLGIAKASVIRLRNQKQRSLQIRFLRQVADTLGFDMAYFAQQGPLRPWTAFRLADKAGSPAATRPATADAMPVRLWIEAQLTWLKTLPSTTVDARVADALVRQATQRTLEACMSRLRTQGEVDLQKLCRLLENLTDMLANSDASSPLR